MVSQAPGGRARIAADGSNMPGAAGGTLTRVFGTAGQASSGTPRTAGQASSGTPGAHHARSIDCVSLVLAVGSVAVGVAAGEPGERIDPATRARLLLALLAIMLLGAGLIAMIVLGGRMVRRWARMRPASKALRRDALSARPVVLDDTIDDQEPDANREHLDDGTP